MDYPFTRGEMKITRCEYFTPHRGNICTQAYTRDVNVNIFLPITDLTAFYPATENLKLFNNKFQS